LRKYLYPILLLSFGVAVAALFFFRKPEHLPELKARHGDLAAGGEWVNTKSAVAGLLADLRANPDDTKAQLLLAQAYMQEGRITGDHTYYDMAAMKLLTKLLRQEPANFEALCCKASLSLTQHHFSEGLAVAEQALKINPHKAFVYGLLCDANVELGRYQEAVHMADKMNALRPDLRAYARVSYLREIYGDLPGAIEAMTMAAKAGYPGLEQTEWARITLGPLAEQQYQESLAERPGYSYALAGLGRVAKAHGDYPAAIKYFQQARATVKDYAFADELTDLYRLNHEPAKAEQMSQEAIAMLTNDAQAADDNELIGHYADRELAYAYLKTKELDKALEHANIEYARRPDNIDVEETLAWVHYKRGEYAEADKQMQRALRMKTKNPTLLCRAGLIATKTGRTAAGQALIREALALNPYLNMDLADEGKQLLAVK
jgi:tetratricopeptide (TPR) repeat protein